MKTRGDTPEWSDEFTDYALRYRPNGMDAEQYGRLEQVLLPTLRRLAQPASLQVLKTMLTVSFSYLAWAEEAGYPLRGDVLWSQDLVNEFVETELAPNYPAATWAARRSYLERIGRNEHPELFRQKPKEGQRRKVRPPTPASDLDMLRRLPQKLATPRLGQAAKALIACSAGAGLSHGDYRHLRGIDIQDVAADLVSVDIRGDRARRVVAFADWTEDLRQVRDEAGDELVLGGVSPDRKHLTHKLCARLRKDDTYVLDASALRSHWLVRHLNQGTPLPILMEAAGLKTTRTLNELLPFVEPDGDPLSWLGGRS